MGFFRKYKTPLIIGGSLATGGIAGALLGSGTSLGAGVGALVGGSIGSSLGTAYSSWENQNYERNLQDKIFAREDSSMSRQIADLQANGMSKVLAAGGSGYDAGSIVNSTAPKMDIGALEAMAIMKQETDMSYTKEQTNLAKWQQANAEQDWETKIIDQEKGKADLIGKNIQNAYDSMDLQKYIKSGISKNGSSALGKIFGDAMEGANNPNVQNSMEKMINKLFPYSDYKKYLEQEKPKGKETRK